MAASTGVLDSFRKVCKNVLQQSVRYYNEVTVQKKIQGHSSRVLFCVFSTPLNFNGIFNHLQHSPFVST